MKDEHAQDDLKSKVDDAGNRDAIAKYPRLPCRGCIASCKNYHRCDGKLWRIAE